MPVTSPHIWYQGNTAYDLRRVLDIAPMDDVTTLRVRFEFSPSAWLVVDKTTFEAAYQASLSA